MHSEIKLLAQKLETTQLRYPPMRGIKTLREGPLSWLAKAREAYMTGKHLLLVAITVSAPFLLVSAHRAAAEPPYDLIIRLAELEIDPAQLDGYKSALKEEIATSVRVEPGVLKLYAVSVKDHPNQIRLFEIYRDQASYHAHLQTPHFKKYKAATQNMVKSLTLIETEPVLLGSRSR